MTPARQLAAFLAKYEPAVARTARGALARLKRQLPGANQLVYDNCNALAIGFGPNEETSLAVISVAAFPLGARTQPAFCCVPSLDRGVRSPID